MVKSINQTFSVFSQLYSELHDKQFETWFLIAYIAQEFHCSRKTCLYFQQLCPWLFFQILEPFYGVTNFEGSGQWNSRSLSHVQQLNSIYMCPVCALAFHYLTPFCFFINYDVSLSLAILQNVGTFLRHELANRFHRWSFSSHFKSSFQYHWTSYLKSPMYCSIFGATAT